MSPLIVTVIQTDLHWEDKKANLSMLEKKIRGIEEKTMLVILPEMFSTGFSMKPEALAETMDGPSVQWMKKIAAEKKDHSYRQPYYRRPGPILQPPHLDAS